MLIKFSVENFLSIKEKQTLSFEADKSDKHLEDYYIIEKGKYRLLKLSLIYGKNASGKTNILKALDFLRILVLKPQEKKTDSLEFQPFLFNENTPNQNSILSIEFLQNEVRYFYEIEFHGQAIIREELNFYNPKKANVFKRTTDTEKQLSKIIFGSKIEIDNTTKKILEANTIWNNTVFGGFLKTNVDVNELSEVIDWFTKYLRPLIFARTQLSQFITQKIEQNEVKKSDILNILKKADFNISDVIIEENEIDIPDGLIDFLETSKAPASVLSKLKDEGKITDVEVQFEHTIKNKKYNLSFNSESQGTQRYYGFAGILTLLLKGSSLFPIDELETSLHPDLFEHFLLSFLVNSTHSQIIATTHNREILNNKDIFRNDAIWITDKNEEEATCLYSLADFNSKTIRNTSSIYNAYKIGKLGGVPELGDYYIDVNYGETEEEY